MERRRQLILAAQQGDEKAKETLVMENGGLVWSIVRRFQGRGHELEDLYQIGVIGLLKCIAKFDLSMDVQFSTYAVPMILGEVRRFLRDDGMIKVSRPLKELAVKAKQKQAELMQKDGQEITVSQLAEALAVSVEELVVALEANRDVESIYATVQGGEEKSPIYMIDRLQQKEGGDGAVVEKITLKQMLSTLAPKEQKIIFMRYFEDKTQGVIAKEMGLSQVQVSRIEKKVLLGLREKMR